tara:strand:- start:51 stop:182 length:132 start_codon:yes stop_codon:yes gene_type:complete
VKGISFEKAVCDKGGEERTEEKKDRVMKRDKRGRRGEESMKES